MRDGLRPPLLRASLRYSARHPAQLGLAALGIALGVAIAVGMDLAIGSAREAFRISAETVAGRATHQIVGDVAGVPTETHTRLRVELGMRDAAPVVEEDVAVTTRVTRVFRLLGIDPFAETGIRPFLGDSPLAVPLLLRERSVWLSRDAAADLGVDVADTLRIAVAGRTESVVVAGLLEPEDAFTARAVESLLIADISTAQEILRRTSLDRIDLRIEEGPGGDARLARIEHALPAGVRVIAAGTRADALLEMTRAFRLNLTALSLLAVLFGIFFIYNAVTFSVVQRRALFATYRTLGVTRSQLVRSVLLEAALLGLIGGIAGVALGIALGRGLVGFVTTTINDLYFAVGVRSLALPPGSLSRGLLLGLGGSLAAALPASLEAAGVAPAGALVRSTLERRVRHAAPRLAAAGAILAAFGLLVLVPRADLTFAFVGIFAIVIGCALLTPFATMGLMRLLRAPAARLGGPLGRIAAGGVSATLSRTTPALAALMVAVATTIALGIMIGSFRASVVSWLETTLQADVYISAPGLVASRPEGAIDPRLVRRIRETPGVAAIATYRRVELDTEAGPLRLGVLGPAAGRTTATYRLAAGDPREAWPAFEAGQALVSEPLAFRERLRPGDSITIPTRQGHRAVRIAGIFYDYGPDRGIVLLHRDTYAAWFDDASVGSLAVYAEPDVAPGTLIASLRAATSGAEFDQTLNIRSNVALRTASLEVFDRTFLVTAVLRVLAFIVAFVGVLAALAALQLERAREFGTLRALGATPRQLTALATAQTGLLGLAAGLFALPLGTLLAAIMIHVVNRRSFGWSLAMQVPPSVLLASLALAVAAALAAGMIPGWRIANAPVATTLRND